MLIGHHSDDFAPAVFIRRSDAFAEGGFRRSPHFVCRILGDNCDRPAVMDVAAHVRSWPVSIRCPVVEKYPGTIHL
jgi:hypothetical protein